MKASKPCLLTQVGGRRITARGQGKRTESLELSAKGGGGFAEPNSRTAGESPAAVGHPDSSEAQERNVEGDDRSDPAKETDMELNG